jgi:hypothetical protein
MKILIFILIFYFLIAQPTYSQFKVRGIVRDYEFGDVIPKVTVIVDTTNNFRMDGYGKLCHAKRADGTYEKMQTSISNREGGFLIDSVSKKKINLIFAKFLYEYFVIENVVLNKPDIDLGEILMFRSSFMSDGYKEIKDSTGKVVDLVPVSDSYEGMFSRYEYRNLKEVQLCYPVYGIRKRIRMSGSCLVMDFKELMRKK